eukprot:GHRR01005934.1.p1 GENE.GHRR01005934.1~~GHRR01005934.1.p1  ORF type:complete len:1224 (+),score=620.67 GHRR01005934.1:482-4153(+)
MLCTPANLAAFLQADPSAAEDQPVFLYHKVYLRPGAAPPLSEPLPMMEVTVPGLPSVGLRHPLQSAHSPLIRALPDYEAQFQQQQGEARAYWEASRERLNKCRQLMSEQEVQARAADAARANVESHFKYIAAIYVGFADKYVVQHRHHSNLLNQFAALSVAMSSIELPAQLVTPQWRVLADLQPHRARLAEWHDSCKRSHEHFAQKVSELESVFQLLHHEVEKLFMQAPSVDLDALGLQLVEAEELFNEQQSIVQVLSKDLMTVKDLVEQVVAQLGGSAGGASLSGAAVHDTCAAVDTMHENHLHSLLPRVRACDASISEFLLRCSDAKARMTRDVLEQLQGIAAQQSRIRDMKHKLHVFNEVLTRQAAAFAELQTATRLPAAYRLALAECVRRAAWQEMFASQASRLAEHCGRITSKEACRREGVRRQLERYLPLELLAKAGLLQDPPHCSVSVPPADAILLPVTPADITRLPAIIQQAADSAANADRPVWQQQPQPQGEATSSTAVRSAAPVSSSRIAGAAASTVVADTSRSVIAAVQSGSTADASSNAALEAARLRAELASLLAQAAARELGYGTGSTTAQQLGVQQHGAGMGMSALASHPAGAAPAGAASISLAASATSAPAAPAAAHAMNQGGTTTASPRPYGHGGAAVVPAGVAAPLPNVSSMVQEIAQQQEQQAAAAAARQAMTLAPVQAALAAKDELVSALDARCQALTTGLADYKARIAHLESQLAAAYQQQAARSTNSSSIAGIAGQFQGQKEREQHHQQAQQQDPQQEMPLPVTTSTGQAPALELTFGSGMLQSVAPAFALDATQAASFFGGPNTRTSPRDPMPSTTSAAVHNQAITAQTVQAAAQDLIAHAAKDAATVHAPTDVASEQLLQQEEQQQVEQDQQDCKQEEPQLQQPLRQQQQLAEPQQDTHATSLDITTTAEATVAASTSDTAVHGTQVDRTSQVEQPIQDAQQTWQDARQQEVGSMAVEQQPHQQDVQLQPSEGKHQLDENSCGSRSYAIAEVPSKEAAVTIEDSQSAALQLQANDSSEEVHTASATADSQCGSSDANDNREGAATTQPSVVASCQCPVAAAPLSVSEPDLRAVMVARPHEVAAHQQQGAEGRSATAATARHYDRHSLDGSLPAQTGAAVGAVGGLSSLLTSSMHFLFHRAGSSRGESSSSTSGASPVVSPTAASPPTSPPASRAAAAVAIGSPPLAGSSGSGGGSGNASS